MNKNEDGKDDSSSCWTW